MAMALALCNIRPLHCLMHFSVLCGFTRSMTAGPIWLHERWHTIHVGQPVLSPIASCIRGYCYSLLSEPPKDCSFVFLFQFLNMTPDQCFWASSSMILNPGYSQSRASQKLLMNQIWLASEPSS